MNTTLRAWRVDYVNKIGNGDYTTGLLSDRVDAMCMAIEDGALVFYAAAQVGDDVYIYIRRAFSSGTWIKVQEGW
jgi:hypothetical protein